MCDYGIKMNNPGRLFVAILALGIIIILALFTSLPEIEFILKFFVVGGVLFVSVQIWNDGFFEIFKKKKS